MFIEELHCKPSLKNVTVNLNYDEVKDIANGLYACISQNEENAKKFENIYNKMSFLRDMIKHGNIQEHTVKRMNNEIQDNERV